MGRHAPEPHSRPPEIPHATRTSLAKFQAHDRNGGGEGSGRVTLFSMEHGQHETIWSRETPSEPPTPYGRRLCDVAYAPIPADKHEKLLADDRARKEIAKANKRGPTDLYSEDRAVQRKATEAFKATQEKMRCEPKKTMPLSQMRDMVKERMQAIMMQDRKSLRGLFNKFCLSDSSRQHGLLDLADFRAALREAGVDMSEKDASRFMDKFCTKPGRMSFEDLFMNLVGLPEDFFTMNLHRAPGASTEAVSRGRPNAVKSLRPVLPRDTTVGKVEKLFKMRLRERLFNVDGAIVIGLKRNGQNETHMTEDHLFEVMRHHGLLPSRKELAELMCHFDQNRDGKIEFTELACELLQLPRPSHVRHVLPFYPDRPSVSPAARRLLHKLAIACERAGAPPARIYNLFRQFDKDGSGSIAYDELEAMTREFGCEVEGKDSAALLLDKFTGGKGAMGYMTFITEVIGLQPDALKSDPNSSCPATPMIVEKASEHVKKVLFGTEGAQNKLLSIFDKDGGGTVSLAEFQQGVHELNLPVDRKQINALFKQFEKAQKSKGSISVMQFTKNLFGMSTHRSSQSGSSFNHADTRPLPTSRGGSPCMPKEFRENRPRSCMSVMSDPEPMRRGPLGAGLDQLHPMLRSVSRTPEPHGSARHSLTPISTHRSRAPSHRINNLRREPHCKYSNNFCVTDSGQDHNFSPQLAASLVGANLKSSRSSRSRKQPVGLMSKPDSLPSFQLASTYGRNHDE